MSLVTICTTRFKLKKTVQFIHTMLLRIYGPLDKMNLLTTVTVQQCIFVEGCN